MLIQCWSTVYDAGPTLDQHCNRSGLNCGCLFTQLLSDIVSNQLLAPSHAYKLLKINGETVARMQEIAHTARLGAKVLGTSVLWYSSTDFAVLVGTQYLYF